MPRCYWWIDNNQWVKTEEGPFELKNNILTYGRGEYRAEIIYVDENILMIKFQQSEEQDGDLWTAEKIYTHENSNLIGTWYCAELKSTIEYKSDKTYLCTYEGQNPLSGEFGILNNYLWYQSAKNAGMINIYIYTTTNGMHMEQTVINSNGLKEIYIYKKQS